MKQDKQSLETQVALLNQFNDSVVMPFIKESKAIQAKMLERLESLDYVHRDEYEEHKLEAERNLTQAYKDFNNWKKEVKEEFNKQSKSRFIQNTLAVLFGAILAFLSQYALKDILGG